MCGWGWRGIGVGLMLALLGVASDSRAQVFIGTAPACGAPVYQMPNSAGASAFIWNGTPVILVDPSSTVDANWFAFVLAHECAHHVAGHTLPTGTQIRIVTGWATFAQELEADCLAARSVPAYVAQYAAAYFNNVQGPNAGAPGYPTGFQRAANILQCIP